MCLGNGTNDKTAVYGGGERVGEKRKNVRATAETKRAEERCPQQLKEPPKYINISLAFLDENPNNFQKFP